MSNKHLSTFMSLHNIQTVSYELNDAEMKNLREIFYAWGRPGSEDIAINELFRAKTLRTHTDCIRPIIRFLNETGLVNIPAGWKFPEADRDSQIHPGTRVLKNNLSVGEQKLYYIATNEQYVYREELTGQYAIIYDDVTPAL